MWLVVLAAAWAVGSCLLGVALVYFTYPVPPGLTRRTWKARIFLGHLKIGRDLIKETLFAGVRVRLYIPNQRRQLGPGMLFIHGGGWCLGNAECYDPLIHRVARKTNMVIVSIDYRLAPKFTFPTPLQDCFDATKYFLTHAEQYGVDRERIAIAGDSAGGNLTAAVCLRLRDERVTPRIKRQILLYPCLQALDFNLPSYQQNKNDPLLPQHLMAIVWLSYAKGNSDEWKKLLKNQHTPDSIRNSPYADYVSHDLLPTSCFFDGYVPNTKAADADEKLWRELRDVFLNPYFAPLMADNLSELPHTYIITCKYDPLRNDGILYAKRLEQHGVDVQLIDNERGIHGLMSFFVVFEEGKRMIDKWAEYLVKSL